MLQNTYLAKAGTVELGETTRFHDAEFGYTLFEEIVDPASPEGPRAIAMHVPANCLSKAWQLVEPDYRERIELLAGTANLVVNRAGTDEWTTVFLTPEDPTGDDIEIGFGDTFCIVTEEEPAVVLSRPSKKFDITYEVGRTTSPKDELSRFILAHVASQ